jgi:hypothetical protein
MANQTIVKPLGLIKDSKIFVHRIPYTITFIVIQNNVLDYGYFMLLSCPWLKNAKIFYVSNTITNQGTNTIKTIFVTKKLGDPTNRPEC